MRTEPSSPTFYPTTPYATQSDPPPVASGSMSPFTSYNQKPGSTILTTSYPNVGPQQGSTVHTSNPSSNPAIYRPAFAGPSAFFPPRQPPTGSSPPRKSPLSSNYSHPNPLSTEMPARQIIDLTGSPSPPPGIRLQQPIPIALPPELPPKTPVCIGQLTVTALVLYPVPYLLPQDPNSGEAEWASVRLQYEHNPHKPGGSETIHIKAPHRSANGEAINEEGFGVVEQKVATSLGPMLGKGLIRLDAKVRRGPPTVRIHSLFLYL